MKTTEFTKKELAILLQHDKIIQDQAKQIQAMKREMRRMKDKIAALSTR